MRTRTLKCTSLLLLCNFNCCYKDVCWRKNYICQLCMLYWKCLKKRFNQKYLFSKGIELNAVKINECKLWQMMYLQPRMWFANFLWHKPKLKQDKHNLYIYVYMYVCVYIYIYIYIYNILLFCPSFSELRLTILTDWVLGLVWFSLTWMNRRCFGTISICCSADVVFCPKNATCFPLTTHSRELV